jgi:hypothetical protein
MENPNPNGAFPHPNRRPSPIYSSGSPPHVEKPSPNGTFVKHHERNALLAVQASENESGSVLSYEHLSYAVPAKKKELPKVLVDDISVRVRAGELLAIMVRFPCYSIPSFYPFVHMSFRSFNRSFCHLFVLAFRSVARFV